jgi:hypothetical protein
MKPKVKPRAGDGSGAAGGAEPRKKLKPKDYEKQLPPFPDRMKMNESLMANCALTINGGSSSVKFALFGLTEPPVRMLSGQVERIGLPDTALSAKGVNRQAIRNVREGKGGKQVDAEVTRGISPLFRPLSKDAPWHSP